MQRARYGRNAQALLSFCARTLARNNEASPGWRSDAMPVHVAAKSFTPSAANWCYRHPIRRIAELPTAETATKLGRPARAPNWPDSFLKRDSGIGGSIHNTVAPEESRRSRPP